jgi:hypothetical protein
LEVLDLNLLQLNIPQTEELHRETEINMEICGKLEVGDHFRTETRLDDIKICLRGVEQECVDWNCLSTLLNVKPL